MNLQEEMEMRRLYEIIDEKRADVETLRYALRDVLACWCAGESYVARREVRDAAFAELAKVSGPARNRRANENTKTL